MRLPRTVRVGPVWTLAVRQVTQRELRKLANAGPGERYDGYWLGELDDAEPRVQGTIYVYRKLSQREKWAVYRHELVHALHDIEAWYQRGVKEGWIR